MITGRAVGHHVDSNRSVQIGVAQSSNLQLNRIELRVLRVPLRLSLVDDGVRIVLVRTQDLQEGGRLDQQAEAAARLDAADSELESHNLLAGAQLLTEQDQLTAVLVAVLVQDWPDELARFVRHDLRQRGAHLA